MNVPSDNDGELEVPPDVPTEIGGYPIKVFHEDGLWVAVAEGLPGGATDVEDPADLADAVRDLVATLTSR